MSPSMPQAGGNRPTTTYLNATTIAERRAIHRLADRELSELVRGLHAVDRAADAGRRAREAA